MKYLNYIIKQSPLQPEKLLSEKRYLRQMTVIIVVPVSVLGVLFIAGLIPGAGLMDLHRLTKLRYLQWKRKERRKMYVKAVLLSLGRPTTKSNVMMLMAV